MVFKHLRHDSISFVSSLPKPAMAYIQNNKIMVEMALFTISRQCGGGDDENNNNKPFVVDLTRNAFQRM
jgi:hypothetical protein